MEQPSPPDPDLPPDRHPLVALLLAALVVVAFLATQVVALALLGLAHVELGVHGRVDVREGLVLITTQVVGIAFALAPLLLGMVTRARLALAPPPGALRAATLALLPVGLLVVGPSLLVTIAQHDRLLAPGMDATRAAMFVVLASLIAVNEELWFRGHVVDRLGAVRRPMFAAIASAVLFGLPHFTGSAASLLNAGAVTLAVGVPFAAVRLRHRALLPLIFWHAVIDTWAFLHEAAVEAQGHPSNAEVVAGMFLPALVAAGYLTWLARARVTP
ncbi:MAG: intrarane metalloprotease [Thermoleophilia bacterium]|nr:intrarane metalloprotease [Thermoleophilia bacterium]